MRNIASKQNKMTEKDIKESITKEQILIGGGIIILVLIAWLSFELGKKSKFKEENKSLKEDKLKLLKELLNITKEIPNEIKTQIEKLVTEYEDVAPDVSQELLDVISLIEQNMESKAIATLAKVIENLLKNKFAPKMLFNKFKTEEEFTSKKLKISFFKVIEFAKSENFISESEYSLILILKDFRNKSSHELDVKIGENWQIIAFLTGIEIVCKLKESEVL